MLIEHGRLGICTKDQSLQIKLLPSFQRQSIICKLQREHIPLILLIVAIGLDVVSSCTGFHVRCGAKGTYSWTDDLPLRDCASEKTNLCSNRAHSWKVQMSVGKVPRGSLSRLSCKIANSNNMRGSINP